MEGVDYSLFKPNLRNVQRAGSQCRLSLCPGIDPKKSPLKSRRDAAIRVRIRDIKYFIFYFWGCIRSSKALMGRLGGGGHEAPLWRVNEPKKTGACRARARTRGQNPLVGNVWPKVRPIWIPNTVNLVLYLNRYVINLYYILEYDGHYCLLKVLSNGTMVQCNV
jgi:hypothetical protein